MRRRLPLLLPLVILLATGAGFTAGAEVLVGAKKAVNLSVHVGPPPPFPKKRRPVAGWDAGVWVGFPLGSRLGVQGEWLYASRGDRVKEEDSSVKIIYTYFDLPLLLKWEVGRWSVIRLLAPQAEDFLTARLYGGLRYSKSLSGLYSEEIDGLYNSWILPEEDYGQDDLSLVLGAEWQVSFLHHLVLVDLRYAVGFFGVDHPEMDLHHSALSLFLGYGFRLKSEERRRRRR